MSELQNPIGDWIAPGATPEILLVLECPSRHDVVTRQPLSGTDEYKYRNWWQANGFSRKDFQITYVYPFECPKHQLVLADQHDIWLCCEHLVEQVKFNESIQTVVVTGNYGLYALTGHGQVSWNQYDGNHKRPGIDKLRGGVYKTYGYDWKEVPVVATLPPSAVYKMPGIERACQEDWKKVARVHQEGFIDIPEREHFVQPTMSDLWTYHDQLMQQLDKVKSMPIAIDIERPATYTAKTTKPTKANPRGKTTYTKDYKTGTIACVGLSWDETFSFVIPTTVEYWGSDVKLQEVWHFLQSWMRDPRLEWVTHNGLFDMYHLRKEGCEPARWWWDTMYMHHALDPRDKHSLEYVASVDTNEPHWKDESHSKGKGQFQVQDQQFWTYCGKDCTTTLQLQRIYKGRHQEEGVKTWYVDHYRDLLMPLLNVMSHGLRVNEAAYEQLVASNKLELAGLRKRLVDEHGKSLLATKGLSPKKMQAWLYDQLRLPLQHRKRGRQAKTVSADAVAMRTLMQQYPDLLKEKGELVLRYQEAKTIHEQLDRTLIDEDGRFRPGYSLNVEYGGLQSSKNHQGTGGSMYNRHQTIRPIFQADDDCVMMHVELSYPETRIWLAYLYSLSQNAQLLPWMLTHPDDEDLHEMIFSSFLLEYGDAEKRKQIQDAIMMMLLQCGGAQTLSDNLCKMDIFWSVEECKAILGQMKRRIPEIDTYHRWVRRQLNDHRCLINAWGGKLPFTYDRLDNMTCMDAYRYFPLSNASELLLRQGVRVATSFMEIYQAGAVNAITKNGILASVQPEYLPLYVENMKASLEKPIVYHGTDLSVPVVVTSGNRYGRLARYVLTDE